MSKAGPGNLSDAITGLKHYEELDATAHKLWEALDKSILSPRTDLSLPVLPSVKLTKVC